MWPPPPDWEGTASHEDVGRVAAHKEQEFFDGLELLATTDQIDSVIDSLSASRQYVHLRERKLKKVLEPAFARFADRILADDVVTATEYNQLYRLAEAVRMDVPLPIERRALIGSLNGGLLPTAAAPALIAKPGEVVHLEVPARLMKEVTMREFRGGYNGFSFRVAKGVRFHTGSARGRSVVVGTKLVAEDTGALSVTSRRATFLGTKKTIDLPYAKLASLEVFSDGVRFHQENRVNAPLFAGFDGEVIAAMINATIQREEATSMPRPAPPKPAGADVTDTKVCPDCAETVKKAARVCRYCGYRFDSSAGDEDA